MAQRHSEYALMDRETYVTPQWVWDALYSVEPWAKDAWDCAPEDAGFDFLALKPWEMKPDIATNPPFSISEKFVRHALEGAIRIAMLLPFAWNTAKSRRDLFEGPTAIAKAKYTLTKRIRWENLEQKKNGPSANHAWFVWDQSDERVLKGLPPIEVLLPLSEEKGAA